MKIGFVTPEYVTETYFSGGLANYIHRVAKALVSLGHEVAVVTFSEIDQSSFDHEGIQVHRVTLNRLHRQIDRLTRHRIKTTSRWLEFSWQAYRKLKHLHQHQPFHILQYPNSRACGLMASLLLRVPYVIRISCYRPVWNDLAGIRRDWDAKTNEWLELIQLRLAAHIYAPSYTLQKLLAEEENIHKVQVIRTPFFLETVAWDASIYEAQLRGKPYLLFFGRFQLHKGFHILAQALPPFLENNPEAYAVCVGLDSGSPLGPSMKAYARALAADYDDRLILIDQTPHAQLYPIIEGAKLVVLPSLIDNLPNACLEAMALGKPVIGTIGASFEELIREGETGFLVSANAVDLLTEAMHRAWHHPDLVQIGQRAKTEMEQFSIEKTVTDLVNFYQKIIS